MGTGKFNAGGNPVLDKYPILGKIKLPLVPLCHRDRRKPLGLYADFIYEARYCSYLRIRIICKLA